MLACTHFAISVFKHRGKKKDISGQRNRAPPTSLPVLVNLDAFVIPSNAIFTTHEPSSSSFIRTPSPCRQHTKSPTAKPLASTIFWAAYSLLISLRFVILSVNAGLLRFRSSLAATFCPIPALSPNSASSGATNSAASQKCRLCCSLFLSFRILKAARRRSARPRRHARSFHPSTHSTHHRSCTHHTYRSPSCLMLAFRRLDCG